jgi:hypothetical protein
MEPPFNLFCITNREVEIEKQKRQRDAMAAQAINILREPLADTFLGRKHYDLIPLPHEIETE